MRTLKDIVLLKDLTDRRGRRYDQASLLEQLDGKTLYGELGQNPDMTINMSKVSHMIENIRMVDGAVLADMRLLDTPCGRIAESLIEAGAVLNTSMRAIGIVDEDNNVSDFKLITFDLIEG